MGVVRVNSFPESGRKDNSFESQNGTGNNVFLAAGEHRINEESTGKDVLVRRPASRSWPRSAIGHAKQNQVQFVSSVFDELELVYGAVTALF